ncbi:MAG TPA: hypothetical protein VIK63_02805 [Haloplasmataceae bacterium]
MNLTQAQLECLVPGLNSINLVEGYSGVGKSVVLLEKFFRLKDDNRKGIILVKNECKKFYLNLLAKSNYKQDIDGEILSFEAFVNRYLESLEVPLKIHQLTEEEKLGIIESFVDEQKAKELDLTLETILNEIAFIQQNICLDVEGPLHEIFQKEYLEYYHTARKYSVKGLLNRTQKLFIWNIYESYVKHTLHYDIFDKKAVYQNVLRLLFRQAHYGKTPYLCNNLFIDDIQDFSLVELNIIYHLFDRREIYYLMMTHDPLQAFDRYRYYEQAALLKCVNHRFILSQNFKNSPNIHRIIRSHIQNNELFNASFPYESANPTDDSYRAVLSFFYNKKKDEKIDVIFDRLDLLLNHMDYRYEDILIIFYDPSSYESLVQVFKEEGIPIISLKERLQLKQSGIVYMLKEEIMPIPFKVVILYDADNKKIGYGHINLVSNVQRNYEDSVRFYQSISNATELLIIQTSVSEPSSFLLPSMIDHQAFSFEVASHFAIKPQLNVLRLRDFLEWITDQLITHYGYEKEDFSTHPTFDLIIKNGNDQIALKIHEPQAGSEEIGEIIKKGFAYDYIVLFDNYHYIVYQNVQKHFVRQLDFPMKKPYQRLILQR